MIPRKRCEKVVSVCVCLTLEIKALMRLQAEISKLSTRRLASTRDIFYSNFHCQKALE